MASMFEAAMAASVVIGLMSIPAASQSVETSNSFQTDLPNVSTSETVPREETSSTSSDRFHTRIETAFTEFESFVTPEESNATVENPGSRLEVNRKPSETSWLLTTPSGTLEIVKSTARRVETVSTPEGTLTVEEENGEVTESFEGADRQEVEAAREELRELLEKRRNDIEKHAEDQEASRLQASISIRVKPESPEHVIITNSADSEISVDGWMLSDKASSHVFESGVIPAEGKFYAYSAEKDEVDVSEEDGAKYVYDTGISWNNDGDTATLEDEEGQKIAESSY